MFFFFLHYEGREDVALRVENGLEDQVARRDFQVGDFRLIFAFLNTQGLVKLEASMNGFPNRFEYNWH